MSALLAARPARPYPGLRPFEAEEWSIFFGRERMIDEVIERLALNGLVLIHGASGSGKSSLVRAGVMPKLARQYQRHGEPWLTCAMRPSGGPLWNLATEFAALEGRGDDIERIGALAGAFNARGATLASVAATLANCRGKSLCLLVDQFEELFRFEKETSREEAELFVDLIGRAATGEAEAVDLHVIVTMRSEFLGECARFAGLAETINRTQYLVPRMDDDALPRAVRRPAQLYGGAVSEDLADRLIASVRGREDELPLLQHGLMLMWDEALAKAPPDGRPELDGAMVDAAGGLAELLSQHADAVMQAVAPDARRAGIVETLFRALTDVNAEGSAIRRPQSFRALCAVTGATAEELRPILDAFRAPGVSFLTPYAPAPIVETTRVDISHEALIRCWRRISAGEDGWLKREFDEGLAWRSLLVEARGFEADKRRVLSPGSTEDRGGLFAARNSAWSERYGGGWERVGALLAASRAAAARAALKWRAAIASLILLTTSALTAAAFSVSELREANAAKVIAELRENEANAHRKEADAQRQEAVNERKTAVAEQVKAEENAQLSHVVFDEFGNNGELNIDNKTAIYQLFHQIELLADRKNSVAQNLLGIFYEDGFGTTKNYVKALELYEEAASAGQARALRDIGHVYFFGNGVQQSYRKAREWYQKASELGDPGAMYSLGSLYAEGEGVAGDGEIARQWYEKAAAAGDADAMDALGSIYYIADGVDKDDAKARFWFEQAAYAGNIDAMDSLGAMYYRGEGGERDEAKARDWYEKAAGAGGPNEMYALAVRYQRGQDSSQSSLKAHEWYEKAADAGSGAAMNVLGAMYLNGDVVAEDEAKAREWFERGANAGNSEAMNNLGGMYWFGQGGPKDFGQSLYWYDKSARTIESNRSSSDLDYEDRLATALGNVSWLAIIARDFSRALSATERAHKLAPNLLWTEINHAHALMFLGRTAEARALYLAHRDEPIPTSDNKPWRQTILDDFADLRQAGLTNPLMDEIEAAFAKK